MANILLTLRCRLVHILVLLPGISAVTIFGGTTDLSSKSTTCSSIQEFRCINDICDASARTSAGGCRNGGGGGACGPFDQCNKPDPGHCLDRAISGPGQHSMPTADVGTPKHFYCLNVDTLDVPVVVWENPDCTGDKCYIPASGAFHAWTPGWPNEQGQGNCVDIGVPNAIQAQPCLGLGQNPGNIGTTEGYGVNADPQWVGGSYGIPTGDNATCNANPANGTPPGIDAAAISNPPTDDWTDYYNSNITDRGTDDISDLDKRSLRTRRKKRGGISRPGTGGLRDAYDYRANFILGVQLYWFLTRNRPLGSIQLTGEPNNDAVRPGVRFDVDHIVELQTIISFFFASDDPSIFPGVTQSQLQAVQEFLSNEGRNGESNGGTCSLYTSFATYVGSSHNIQPIHPAINGLKNVLMAPTNGLIDNRRPRTPNYRNSWARHEAEGTYDYLTITLEQAAAAARGIGGWLDEQIAGTGQGRPFAAAFESWVRTLWAGCISQLNGALDGPKPVFKDD